MTLSMGIIIIPLPLSCLPWCPGSAFLPSLLHFDPFRAFNACSKCLTSSMHVISYDVTSALLGFLMTGGGSVVRHLLPT